MKRTLSSLIAAALLAVAPTLALAEDGGRGPAGGAFMSSYSTPPAPYVQPYAGPTSTFALQPEVREPAQPRVERRRSRARR